MPSSSTDAEGERPPAASRPWINVAVSIVATAIFFLLVEGAASVLLSVGAARRALAMKEESHVRYDAELGWSNRPNLHLADFYEPGASLTINAQGLRGLEDYAAHVPPGRYRMVALGDSFTLGFGVDDTQTYAARMESACPALQAVNMGQGGYGLDQDYLWYKRDGGKLDANLLLVAVIAHDFYRMASTDFIGYGKPVLRAREGALRVENVPVPRWEWRAALTRAREFVESLAVVKLGRRVASHLRPEQRFYGEAGSEVFAAAGLALDDLARDSRARGQRMAIVYLPTRDLLPQEPTREATWLEAYGTRQGVPVVNLVPAFDALTPAQLARMYRWDYHYTVEGNRFVSQALLRALPSAVPGFPACAAAAS
jgi:hypothetical protein